MSKKHQREFLIVLTEFPAYKHSLHATRDNIEDRINTIINTKNLKDAISKNNPCKDNNFTFFSLQNMPKWPLHINFE